MEQTLSINLSSFDQIYLLNSDLFLYRKQDEWTRQQIKNNKDDPFWRNAGYIIAQLDGLYMGNVEWAKRQKRTVRSNMLSFTFRKGNRV